MNPPFTQTPSANQRPQQPPQHLPYDSRRVSSDLNEGFQPTTTNSGNTSEPPVECDSEDALEDLDVPDIPINRPAAMGNHKGLFTLNTEVADGVLGWHPPGLVLRPFASDYFAEEVIATLPPPLKSNGSSISRYFAASNCHESIQNVRETSDWASIKDDPVFQSISDNGPFVPIDYLKTHRTGSEHEVQRKEYETDEGEFSREPETGGSQGEHKNSRGWSVMDNLEQALNSRDLSTIVKQRHPMKVEPVDPARAEPQRQLDSNDESLSGRQIPPPKSAFYAPNNSMGQTRSRSRSPGTPDDRD